MSRHVTVRPITSYDGVACYMLTINLWAQDVDHKDTVFWRLAPVRPTGKQLRDFYNSSRSQWRRGVRYDG